jgi:hypothetical protein
MQPKFRVVLYRGWFYAEWRENGVQRRRALRTKHCYGGAATEEVNPERHQQVRLHAGQFRSIPSIGF